MGATGVKFKQRRGRSGRNGSGLRAGWNWLSRDRADLETLTGGRKPRKQGRQAPQPRVRMFGGLVGTGASRLRKLGGRLRLRVRGLELHQIGARRGAGALCPPVERRKRCEGEEEQKVTGPGPGRVPRKAFLGQASASALSAASPSRLELLSLTLSHPKPLSWACLPWAPGHAARFPSSALVLS